MISYFHRQILTRLLAGAALAAATCSVAGAVAVNHLLDELFIEQNVPGTTVVFSDDIANGSFSFSESNMVGLSVEFNNNRHEFRFSDDGVNPLTVNGDEPWRVSFDIQLDATLSDPRKSIFFFIDDGQSSNVNLTTNRSPLSGPGGQNAGLSDPPGESAMFSGKYSFLRLIGPADGAPELNLNPTVGYMAGDQVHLEVIHTPSPDGGVTPSTVEHFYQDTSGIYTTGPRDLRNTGIFADGAEMGFVLQGIAHSGTPVDSYAVTITNFQAVIGQQPSLPGDYNGDLVVNAADYTVWRDHLGSAGPLGDGTGDDLLGTPDGDVDAFDYQFWKANFGATAAVSAAPLVQAVPEPAGMWLVAIPLVAAVASRRRYRKA